MPVVPVDLAELQMLLLGLAVPPQLEQLPEIDFANRSEMELPAN
jgi:hypothetical protein